MGGRRELKKKSRELKIEWRESKITRKRGIKDSMGRIGGRRKRINTTSLKELKVEGRELKLVGPENWR